MTLAEKMKEQSQALENQSEDIKKEIVSYFRERFDNGDFEDWLESRLASNSTKLARKYTIEISFWDYHDGCSGTNFSIGGIVWKNPEHESGYDSWKYKGICLRELQNSVGYKLLDMTTKELKQMGFNITETHNNSNARFHYSREIVITW